MAEKRMFAKSIINSARFLMMPRSSRLLYYDLGMSADDDGIVEAFTVMRTTGAADDDLKVLAARGFIHVLNDELVSQIADWKINNTIRSDRYKKSLYTDLLNTSQELATNGKPSGNQLETQNSIEEIRLEEYRLEKDRLEKEREGAEGETELDFNAKRNSAIQMLQGAKDQGRF